MTEGPLPPAAADRRPSGVSAAPPPLGLASAAAAGAASCLFLLAGPYVAFIAFIVAWFHAILFGLPLYLKLSRTRPLTDGAAIGGGCAVGALPTLLFGVATLIVGGASARSDGLSAAFLTAAVFGFLGMIGGAAFWAVMSRHREPRGFGPLDPPL